MVNSNLDTLDRAKLCAFVATLVGPQDADDVTQDVYLRLLETHRPFAHKARFETWVYAVAKRVALDHHRQAGQRQHAPDAPQALSLSDYEPSVGPVEPADDWRALLDGLPPTYRQAMIVFVESGRSYEAVASALGVPLASAQGLIGRLQKQLRERR